MSDESVKTVHLLLTMPNTEDAELRIMVMCDSLLSHTGYGLITTTEQRARIATWLAAKYGRPALSGERGGGSVGD